MEMKRGYVAVRIDNIIRLLQANFNIVLPEKVRRRFKEDVGLDTDIFFFNEMDHRVGFHREYPTVFGIFKKRNAVPFWKFYLDNEYYESLDELIDVLHKKYDNKTLIVTEVTGCYPTDFPELTEK